MNLTDASATGIRIAPHGHNTAADMDAIVELLPS